MHRDIDGLASSSSSRRIRRPSYRPENLAIVTLFKRDLNAESFDVRPNLSNDDEISMSLSGQRAINAKLNLEPISETDQRVGGKHSFNQAGGHNGSFRFEGPTLVKKISDREATFYESAEKGAWPTSLLPKYFGRVEGNKIQIENLTFGYSRPCVIDLKMGIHTVEKDGVSLLKKMKMTALDFVTRSRSEGCRLEGLSMYRSLEERYVKGTKRQTHALSADVRSNLQDILTFFLTDESGVRTDVALRFQTAIELILQQFERNDKFLFIGSSILLIYDNDNRAPHMQWARVLRKLHKIAPNVRLSEDQISGLTRRTKCDVRMIDFAHTGPLPPGEKLDHGYIHGLKTILKALKAIRTFRESPIFSVRNAAIDLMEDHRARSLAAKESGEIIEAGNFTFDSALKQLTAVSHFTASSVSTFGKDNNHLCEEDEDSPW